MRSNEFGDWAIFGDRADSSFNSSNNNILNVGRVNYVLNSPLPGQCKRNGGFSPVWSDTEFERHRRPQLMIEY